jgi:nitroreductase
VKGLSVGRFVRGIRGILGQRFAPPTSLQDNPVLGLLYARRSTRRFLRTPLPADVMTAILDAGRLAPSTVNLQSWAFGVFDAASWRAAFGRGIPFGGTAAILICGDMHRPRQAIDDFPRKPLVDYTVAVMNASIAAYAMNIAAEALGVGSVMLSDTGRSGFYDGLYLREKLGLPEAVFPLMTLVLGYGAAGPGASPPKLPLDQVVFKGRYRESDPNVMKDWLDGMMSGYRAMHVVKSFKGQLRHYLSKVDEAEKGLHRMIFYAPEQSKRKGT